MYIDFSYLLQAVLSPLVTPYDTLQPATTSISMWVHTEINTKSETNFAALEGQLHEMRRETSPNSRATFRNCDR